MARPEVTGKKQQHSSDIPFAECLFTSEQTRKILKDGKTKFFEKDLPELEWFRDGNKLKITGKSIQALIQKRLAAPRVPRPTPLRKIKTQLEAESDAGGRDAVKLRDLLQEGAA